MSESPDAASRYLRVLRNDLLPLCRTGATPDQVRALADRLNTSIDLTRTVEITREQALCEQRDLDQHLIAMVGFDPDTRRPTRVPCAMVLEMERLAWERAPDGMGTNAAIARIAGSVGR